MLGANAGTNRRGALFLAGFLIFSDALVRHVDIVGPIEDVSSCTLTQVGAAGEFGLFLLVFYVVFAEEDDYRRVDSEQERATEMRAWLAVLLFVSALAATFTAYRCDRAEPSKAKSIVYTFRVLTTAVVCFVNGEEENPD